MKNKYVEEVTIMKKHAAICILTFLVASLPVLSAAQDDYPKNESYTYGMRLVEQDSRGAIYADLDVDWTVYSKIMLDDADVAFRKNWQRDQNRRGAARVTNTDMANWKAELSELFGEVFEQELAENGGFEIVEEAGDDVLRITPHIVDLDVYAPDVTTSNRSRSFTDSSGRMTLKLELYDSVTGDLIAVASQRRESPSHGYVKWSNKVTNKKDAENMLQDWAEGLSERLQAATGKM